MKMDSSFDEELDRKSSMENQARFESFDIKEVCDGLFSVQKSQVIDEAVSELEEDQFEVSPMPN